MKMRHLLPLPSDTPTSFLLSAPQLREKHGPRGVAVRNDLIRDELLGLANDRQSEHTVTRDGDFITHNLPDAHITVKLCAS